MKKTDIIEKFAEATGCTKKASKEYVEALVQIIEDAVASGDGVDIYGFMKIDRMYREPREVRNPLTGEKVMADGKYYPKAKFSSKFKSYVADAE